MTPTQGMPGQPLQRSFLGSAMLFSAMTLLSRILGVLREQLFAMLFGAGATIQSDVFRTAFRIPNLLRDLFAEGALSAAFQPAFTKRLKQEGRASANHLANKLLTLLLFVVGGLVILGIVFAPGIVSLWVGGYSHFPGKMAMTIYLTRWMMPFLLFVSLASVAMAMLNTEQRFVWPALAPVLFNVVSIGVGVFLRWGQNGTLTEKIGWWAIGTLAGGLMQLIIQIPILFKIGYRFRLIFDVRFRDPGMRYILRSMAPAAIGLMAIQINLLINSSLASKFNGAQSWLESAFRLAQLPVGLFGVAIGTVAMTRYAQNTGDASEQAKMSMQATCVRSLRLVLLLMAPCCVGLFILAEPLIRVLFQHGQFKIEDTYQTATMLRMYSIGLIGYAMTKVVAPAFYALGRSRIPVLATICSVAANAGVSLFFARKYGVGMLALGIAVAAMCNAAILLLCFQWLLGGLLSRSLWVSFCKMLFSSAIMGFFLWGLQRGFFWKYQITQWADQKTHLALIWLLIACPLAMVVYAVAGKWMRIEEVSDILHRLNIKKKRQ